MKLAGIALLAGTVELPRIAMLSLSNTQPGGGWRFGSGFVNCDFRSDASRIDTTVTFSDFDWPVVHSD
jgi:hypothetical protein